MCSGTCIEDRDALQLLREGKGIVRQVQTAVADYKPVAVLISGWSGPGIEWSVSPIRQQLEDAGFETQAWRAPLNGWGDIRESARLLSDLIFELYYEQQKEVVLVGHSLGGLIAYEASQISPVAGVVSIAAPHHGTISAILAPWSKSARQMTPYNAFILDHLKKVPQSSLALFFNVACTLDAIVPASSALHPLRTAEYLVPHTHLSVIFSEQVAERVTDYLIGIFDGW